MLIKKINLGISINYMLLLKLLKMNSLNRYMSVWITTQMMTKLRGIAIENQIMSKNKLQEDICVYILITFM